MDFAGSRRARGGRASELTGSRLTNRAVVPRGKVETSKERDLPSGAGVRGRARPGCLEGGWATGRAAVDGVRATARAAGSIRVGDWAATLIFLRVLRALACACVPCRGVRSPWRHRRCSARVCPPSSPSDARAGAGRPTVPAVRSLWPGILFRRSVVSCLDEVRRDWAAWARHP